MYTDISGPITAELAEAEADRLFDAPPAGLPNDLTMRGWKLITRAPDRMFAVSQHWGCTGTKAAMHEVITEARAMVEFCVWAEKNRD